ncbi:hypothetical protein QUF70_05415 [Desulfobacterales bacterium HSG17]|nr:hypothetical protein [Desulfobacterales bacterium HSG17]
METIRNHLPLIYNHLDQLSQAIESAFQHQGDSTGKEPQESIPLEKLERLKEQLITACNSYSPDKVIPVLEELGRYYPLEKLQPILSKVQSFEFDGAKTEAMAFFDEIPVGFQED